MRHVASLGGADDDSTRSLRRTGARRVARAGAGAVWVALPFAPYPVLWLLGGGRAASLALLVILPALALLGVVSLAVWLRRPAVAASPGWLALQREADGLRPRRATTSPSPRRA